VKNSRPLSPLLVAAIASVATTPTAGQEPAKKEPPMTKPANNRMKGATQQPQFEEASNIRKRQTSPTRQIHSAVTYSLHD